MIEPPAVMFRFPLAVKVGRVIRSLSKVSVRLRRAVKPARTGTVAPAFTFRSCTSRKLACVPANDHEPPKLFAWVSSRTSVFAAVAVKDVVPVTASTPVCERVPPVVRARLPLTVEAPRFSAVASVSATLLPLVMPTVLKLFAALFSVILLMAPAARVVTPVTVTAPLCVKAPPVVMSTLPETFETPRVSALASVYWTFPVVVAARVVMSFELFVRV